MKIKSFAKVNIYLKIVGVKNNYHLLNSRFMMLKNLYDILEFKKKEFPCDKFDLRGNFSCPVKKNIIYKAYLELLKIKSISTKLKNFFYYYFIDVQKNIPEFAGLGGGSSNAAFFLQLINNTLSLQLSKQTLLQIGNNLGADVAFFLNNYESANISGIGENVINFDEKSLDLITFTPPIKCETIKVYHEFRKTFEKNYDIIKQKNSLLANKLYSLKSDKILDNFSKEELNDLYLPAVTLYPKLQSFAKKDWFFSGSGSSFFRRNI